MGRRKVITDEKLLKLARKEFLKNGAFGSTKEIASQAGISEAALFKRYPTKAALFLQAMEPEQVDIEAVIHSFTKKTSPPRVLTEIGLRILAYFRTLIPVVMHLTTNPSISMADVNTHFRGKPVDDLVKALASHMKEADAKGIIRVANPIATAGLFVSAMHSLAAFEMMEIHGGKNMDHAVKPFVEALWDGMAPDKPTGTKVSRAKKTRRG